jgi:hypothetical protein
VFISNQSKISLFQPQKFALVEGGEISKFLHRRFQPMFPFKKVYNELKEPIQIVSPRKTRILGTLLKMAVPQPTFTFTRDGPYYYQKKIWERILNGAVSRAFFQVSSWSATKFCEFWCACQHTQSNASPFSDSVTVAQTDPTFKNYAKYDIEFSYIFNPCVCRIGMERGSTYFESLAPPRCFFARVSELTLVFMFIRT